MMYLQLLDPKNTLIAPCSAGHTGAYQATIDNQIAAGLPYTFKKSNFFIRNGQRISRLGFKADDVQFKHEKIQKCILTIYDIGAIMYQDSRNGNTAV